MKPGRPSKLAHHRRPAALALSVNQNQIKMQRNEKDRFDTHRIHESVRTCLTGCTPAEMSPKGASPDLI